MPEATLYRLDSYPFIEKDAQPEEDSSPEARLKRLENYFEKHGMRRTVEAVIVVYEHRLPHILMLCIGGSFFKLPGHYLGPEEDEKEGLKTILNRQLGPSNPEDTPAESDWTIGEVLGSWYRPNFEINMYPYIPAHVTKPKEKRTMYMVHMPPHKKLYVPQNFKLQAIPLHELLENSSRYGPQHPILANLLSRYDFTYHQ